MMALLGQPASIQAGELPDPVGVLPPRELWATSNAYRVRLIEFHEQNLLCSRAAIPCRRQSFEKVRKNGIFVVFLRKEN